MLVLERLGIQLRTGKNMPFQNGHPIPGTAKPNDGEEGDEDHDGAEDECCEESPVAGDDLVPVVDAGVDEAGHVLQVDLVGHGVRQEGQLQHRVEEEVREGETDLDPVVIWES